MTNINTKDESVDLTTILEDDPAAALEAAKNKESPTAISFNAFVELKKKLGFTQIRIICSQDGKDLDMATTNDTFGRAVVDYFTSNVTGRPDACNSFIGIENSELSSRCSEWDQQSGKWGVSGRHQFGDERLYGVLAYISEVSHLSMGAYVGRFECDSKITTKGGNWKMFVR